MLFGRVKPLEAILATAEKKGCADRGSHPVDHAGCRRGDRHRHLRADLRGRAKGRSRHDDLVRHRRFGLRPGGAVLLRMSSMVPVAGSAYTYTYAVMGELLAWMVGWALILEYARGPARRCGRLVRAFVGAHGQLGIHLSHAMTVGPPIAIGFVKGGEVGGIINLPAVLIALLVTALLVLGTKESAMGQRRAGRGEGHGIDRVHRADLAIDHGHVCQFPSLHAERLGIAQLERCGGGGRGLFDLLRLCRVRRGFDGGRRDARIRSATCRSA